MTEALDNNVVDFNNKPIREGDVVIYVRAGHAKLNYGVVIKINKKTVTIKHPPKDNWDNRETTIRPFNDVIVSEE